MTRLQVSVLVAVVVVAVAAAAYVYSTQFGPRRFKELRVAVGIDADTLDPHQQTTSLVSNMILMAYDGLVRFDESGDVQPALAEKWEASSDAKQWTFFLRKEVKFHDGTDFDAFVAKKNFDRMFDPQKKTRIAPSIGPVERTEVIDKFTFRIFLKEPFVPFLTGLGQIGANMVSSKAIDEFGDRLSENIVGTGPFKFVEWVKGTKVVFERFADYWGEKAKVTRITFVIVPEDSTREAMILAGDVDVAFAPPTASLERLRANPRLALMIKPTSRYVMLHFMFHQFAPFNDLRVRQAFNYAIDKQAIIKNILFGTAEVVKAPWQIGFFGYHEVGFYPYDPQKARQLLADAGYPNGFKVKMLHMTGRFAGDRQIAEAVQGYLKDIGVEIELVTGDWPYYINTIYSNPTEKEKNGLFLFLRSWGPSVPDPWYTVQALYHTDMWVGKGEFLGKKLNPAGRNIGYYSNPRVDELIIRATTTPDTQKRIELLNELGRILWEDTPAVFMFQLQLYIGMKQGVTGIGFFQSEYFDFRWADITI